MMRATDATGALDAAGAASTAESDSPPPDVAVLVPEGLPSHAIDAASAKPRTNATSGEMTLGDGAPTRAVR